MAGQILSPPLAKITANDQRGILWTIGTICLAFIHLTLALRVSVRWRRLQPDDYALVAACFLVVSEAGVTFGAVGMGLGSSRLNVENSSTRIAWRLFVVSEVLYIIVTFVVKLAVLWTVEKLLAQGMRERRAFQFTFVVLIAMCLASILAITIDCSGRTCDQQPRWIAVAVMDAVSDIWGFALFCRVVLSLQMKLALKFTSIFILGLRLFCLAFTGVHAYYASTFDKRPDPAVAVINPLAWQQLALTWSLLSAMAVALRPFIRELHTGMGMDLTNINGSGYIESSGRLRNLKYSSFRLQNFSNRTNTSRGSRLKRALADNQDLKDMENGLFADVTAFARGDVQYSAAIYHEQRQPSSSSRNPWAEPIIRREVEYTITYENQ